MQRLSRIPKMAVVNATKRQTASLIIFHGSGSNGDDMKGWVDILNRSEFKYPHIKILYPTAPAQPYTPNNGMVSNVWFDRKDISIDVSEQKESIDTICRELTELIDTEISSGILPNRIVVGGFSMGGALALQMAYKYKPSLGGCFAMSSFLNKGSLVYEYLKTNGVGNTPLLQFHGTVDDLVPQRWGEKTFQNLSELGVKGAFVSLDNTDHEIVRSEIDSLRAWLASILPEN